MTELLKALNKAGLIERLDGDDERFSKIEAASKKVATALSESPPSIIRAVLAGLDPQIGMDDPAMQLAENSLLDEWTSMRSVHIDPPIFIYRSILLQACNQLSEGKNAAILWYSVADALPQVQLGREEKVIRPMLEEWALKTEEYSSTPPQINVSLRAPNTKKIAPPTLTAVKAVTIDRDILGKKVAACTGPSTANGETLDNPNPHWPNQVPQWSHAFSSRMTNLLGEQLDQLSKVISSSQNSLIKQLQESEIKKIESVGEQLFGQRSWLQEVVKKSKEHTKAEAIKLDALWWSESLYSPSLRCSYRELKPVFSAVLMPIDLLALLNIPVPTSVSYTLSETVGKLPEMGFDKAYSIHEILNEVVSMRSLLPDILMSHISKSPEAGRLSLRDLIFEVLLGSSSKLDDLLGRSGLKEDFMISLPRLSQALFRQEQAVMLAGVDFD